MNFVNIGALLGLSNMRYDGYMTGLHLKYLQHNYPAVEYGVSLPRMRPHVGQFQDFNPVADRDFVQILLAYRLFMPSVGINISTREAPEFREKLIPLGATNLSAGVSTRVGGHTNQSEASEAQFEISDHRDLKAVQQAIMDMGYQPVMKNWIPFGEFQ